MSKRVLITGGASGVGRALAERYAAAGDRVLVVDHDQPAELPADAESFMRPDVRIHNDWRRALNWCENHWGGLNILVNNAGVMAAGRIERLHADDWNWILDINLKGVAQGCRAFVPLFKQQGSGHIVNVVSSAGVLNEPGMASYNALKAAVISLSETLHHELGSFGVRVSVICPGPIRTNLRAGLHSPDPVLAELADRRVRDSGLPAEPVAEQIVDAVSKGRFLIVGSSILSGAPAQGL